MADIVLRQNQTMSDKILEVDHLIELARVLLAHHWLVFWGNMVSVRMAWLHHF